MRAQLFLLGILSILVALGCGDDDGATDAATDTSTVDGGDDGGTDDAGEDGGTDDAGDDATTSDATTSDATSDAIASDAAPPARECETDDDCRLVNDCCSCAAVNVDAILAECPVDCLQPLCDAAGISDPTFECLAGTCALRGLECDEDEVLCDAPPPVCVAGEEPHVSGGCWSGLCVPVESCSSVPDCATCPESHACVSSQAFFETLTCVPIDPACGGTPTCECMGDEACGGSPFMCVPTTSGDQDLTCVCPVC